MDGAAVARVLNQGGITVLTYGRGRRPKEVAAQLARYGWEQRERFRVSLVSLGAAVRGYIQRAWYPTRRQ